MKKFLTLSLGLGALFALALAIPATAVSSPDNTGPMMQDAPAGYTCKGSKAKIPQGFKGKYEKACKAAKTEGKKPVRKMMGSMKNSLKKKCAKKAPEGKKAKVGCKSCHKGAGKAGNISSAKLKKLLACDGVYVDK